ncbi:hypothetical protein DICPUDRAFT_58099 [Dictyostelium purpureum]|uniref:Cation/H+ exchanger transmembrane domain-containing protein n=1 Tax=Dictyostelium purpureum TaxID=5786 RepID=F0ZZ47_DICPU|nr:uncharacterized protein DICPUDRAFT_58099 [Dictyostelium purpureum]EGC30774.1 hypothetical protein DICPUDRAFT_58099 [Dictyostelium purpureum]|eukprot:XP_003292690.1 hypothetical protein DICPUDRAFT_58099 [Dictyostelium purpureum]
MAEGVSIATGLNPLTDPIALFIVQVLLIVIISRLLAWGLSYLKQPMVISEVITGIILGPSVLGQAKVFSLNVFPTAAPPSVGTLNVFANIGLIFFMFMVGLEVDISILRTNLKASLIISLTSIIVPFGMGVGLAALLHHYMPFNIDASHEYQDVNLGLFCIFVGVAISITAFPVLARILTERNLMQSRVGISAIAAASVDDVIAWILLAVVVSWGNNVKTGNEGGANLGALWTFLMLIGFVVFIGTVVRFGLDYLYKKLVKNESSKHNFLVFTLCLCLASAFYTQVIGVHAIFGAFLLGIATPRYDGFHIHCTERIEDMVGIILLPLYFTYSGLRTSLESINSGTAGGLTLFIIFVACLGKFGGATLASRFTKKSWRESCTIGVLMNTKGLVELIVLNIGLDIGVLDQTTFTMFVIMALVTTFMTTPIVHFIWTKWEEKQARIPMVPREKGFFNILLYVSTNRVATAMTHIAAAITPSTEDSKKKYQVKSLFLNSTSNRYSSYFYSSNNINNLPPQKKEIYRSLQSESNEVGVKFKPLFVNATDAAEGVTTIAKRQWPDVVLLGYSDRGDDQTVDESHHAGTETFYSKLIIKTLQTVKSCVCVFVDKGLERFHVQHNLLFAYSGEDFENDALTIVMKMSRRSNIKVTVLTNATKTLLQKLEAKHIKSENYTIVETHNPYQDLLSKSSEDQNDFWMIVTAVQREDATKQERLINTTKISLLLVHPSNTLLDPSLKTSSSFANLERLGGNLGQDDIAPIIDEEYDDKIGIEMQ